MGGLLALVFPKRSEIVLGKREKRWSLVPAVLLSSFYVIQAGLRTNNFGDTYYYRNAYLDIPIGLSQLPEYLETITKDQGYTVFGAIVKIFIGNSDKAYFMIVAFIQMACLVYIFRKYSSNYWLSMFIFVASTEYMSWFHNGLRQFLAIALIFAATGLLLKKKYIPLILIIIVASTFHQSALIMIPIVFIVQGKAWNKKSILAILACIVALFYVEQFTDVLDTVLSGTQYSNMVTDWVEWEDDGTNPLRVLVYSVPMILSVFGYRVIKKTDDPLINIATNFSILTTGIALVSMVTSGIFIGRLIIYGSLYSSCILLPWELEHLFNKGSSRIIIAAAVISYIVYYYFQMHFAWGLL
ncbi:MAG: EpsG family protein [Lachnospiraceae bacterium]|nr:EpsG family protein [Lachnospiraceae bacterium]